MSLLSLFVVLSLDRSATISSDRTFTWVENGKSKVVKQVQVKALEFQPTRQVKGIYVARVKVAFEHRENFIGLQSHPVDVTILFMDGKRKQTLSGARIKQVLGIMPSHRIDAKSHAPTLDVTIEAKKMTSD